MIIERPFSNLTSHLPDHKAHPWLFECDEDDCFWLTAHRSVMVAERVKEEHLKSTCPLKSPMRKERIFDMATLVNLIWDELDKATESIFTHDGPVAGELEKVKGEARGLAKAIQIMTTPFYKDADAVVRQAVKRYKMKTGEIKFEETPGAGGYNPMPVDNPRAGGQATKEKTKPKITEKTLDKKATDGIRMGLKAGFPAAALAKSYGVSIATIEGLAILDES